MARQKNYHKGRRSNAPRVDRRKVYRIRNWNWYEPDIKWRKSDDPTQLPYIRLYVAGNREVSRQAVQMEENAIRRAGGFELVGIQVALLKLTASQANYRGYLLNHLGQPASLTEIAEMITLPVETTARAIRALSRCDVGFIERAVWDNGPGNNEGSNGHTDGQVGSQQEQPAEARGTPSEQDETKQSQKGDGSRKHETPSGDPKQVGTRSGEPPGDKKSDTSAATNYNGNLNSKPAESEFSGNPAAPKTKTNGNGTNGSNPTSESITAAGGSKAAASRAPDSRPPTVSSAGQAGGDQSRSGQPTSPDIGGRPRASRAATGDEGIATIDNEKTPTVSSAGQAGEPESSASPASPDLPEGVIEMVDPEPDAKTWDLCDGFASWPEVLADPDGKTFAKGIYTAIGGGWRRSVRAVKREVVAVANQWAACEHQLPDAMLLELAEASIRHAASLRNQTPKSRRGQAIETPEKRRWRVWMAGFKARAAEAVRALVEAKRAGGNHGA